MAPAVPFHGDLVKARSAILAQDLAAGKYKPFVWPYNLFAFYLAFGYLLLPPTKSRLYYFARYPLFVYNVYWCISNILLCRSYNPPMQYGIGIANAYACIWLAFHLIFRDTRTQSFKIAARSKPGLGHEPSQAPGGLQSIREGSVATFGQSSGVHLEDASTRNRHGDAKPPENDLRQPASSEVVKEEYYWQALPGTWSERFYWICSMMFCFRGEGTSHGIRQLPSPSQQVRASLRHNSPRVGEPVWIADPRSTVYGFPTKSACIRHYLIKWTVTYLILDAAKNLIAQDPYFIGFAPITASLQLPPSLTASLPVSVRPLLVHAIFAKSCRLVLAAIGILSLLTNLTSMLPLLFAWPGLATYRPWSYPTVFGSDYVAILAEAGIAGWWGRWWHQMFRLSFEVPLEWARRVQRSHSSAAAAAGATATPAFRLLSAVIAFGLSAALHAAGSHTLNGASSPWAGSAMFFLVQPVGIVIELTGRMLGRKVGLAKALPAWMKATLAFAWVHFWLYHTAPLLCDDVGRGGVWTTEVVPVSLFWGLRGDRWLRWEPWMFGRWHTGDRWYESGIAL